MIWGVALAGGEVLGFADDDEAALVFVATFLWPRPSRNALAGPALCASVAIAVRVWAPFLEAFFRRSAALLLQGMHFFSGTISWATLHNALLKCVFYAVQESGNNNGPGSCTNSF